MNDSSPHSWEIFFEILQNLPQQGSGNRIYSSRTLGLCRGMRETPVFLDLGFGVGGRMFLLAEDLSSGTILAIDSHAPGIELQQEAITERCLWYRTRKIDGVITHNQLAVVTQIHPQLTTGTE